MKTRVLIASGLLALALSAGTAGARGGGGCFQEGTPIGTPSGPVAIERLRPGDAVWSVVDGQIRPAAVQAVIRADSPRYVEILVAGRRLRVTAEHPLAVGEGVFRRAADLKAGDPVILWDGRALRACAIDSIAMEPAAASAAGAASAASGSGQARPIASPASARPAYNLLVSPGGTFLADGVLVHNKGCFLADTPILRGDGQQAWIRDIRPGDELLAFEPDGRIVRTRVREVLTHQVDEYLAVTTDRAVLHVTPEHPFFVGEGTFKAIEALRAGDAIWAFDGVGLSRQRIVRIDRVRAAATVYNLQTDDPHTFFAASIAVHNKGGCFVAGTAILTPAGQRPIEQLARGEAVTAFDDRLRPVAAAVEAIYVQRAALWRVETDCGDLLTTADHPLAVEAGEFRPAAELRAGDRVLVWAGGRLEPAQVRRAVWTGREEVVYNLRVGPPHTFVAGDFLVHNKGGCFVAGTAVLTPAGERPIQTLLRGELVTAIDASGQTIPAVVEGLYAQRDDLWRVETDGGSLTTTADHPFALAGGGFCRADQLQAGQGVLVWRDGSLRQARVRRCQGLGTDEIVYNLRVGPPHTFVAGGFLVHNKGGGGFHSSGGGSGSSSDSWWPCFIVFGIAPVIWILMTVFGKGKRTEQNLDFVYSPSAVKAKADKTRKLLEFIARTDEGLQPAKLEEAARSTFVKLQECWESRDYTPMKPLMMNDLFVEHTAQLQAMVRSHEINRIAQLQVERVEIVNVRYTNKSEQREFTALITASARDYYVDDRTGATLRGDSEPAEFQEFWTFQLQAGAWMLRQIEQSRESQVLKEENFFEAFTDRGLSQIYGQEVGQGGSIGPWQEKQTAIKATRIERMLNFLVQTDKLWDRQQMIERVRQVFLHVYLAQEGGDMGPIAAGELFPDVAAHLRQELDARKAKGTVIEYRNLCVRKVELIHLRNRAGRKEDEFTARVSAHAQRIVSRGDHEITRQDDVTPFVEFWTFGRLEGGWALREMLPETQGQRMIGQENIDEESSPEMVKWYYRQTRAN